MPNLKDLRVRIDSVKSTQKITSAMKMVAAAKLRRAQEQAEAARPYSERMGRMLYSLSAGLADGAGGPELLVGNGKNDIHLLVVMTSDRGLCGGFNSSIVRGAIQIIKRLLNDGKEITFASEMNASKANLMDKVHISEELSSLALKHSAFLQKLTKETKYKDELSLRFDELNEEILLIERVTGQMLRALSRKGGWMYLMMVQLHG